MQKLPHCIGTQIDKVTASLIRNNKMATLGLLNKKENYWQVCFTPCKSTCHVMLEGRKTNYLLGFNFLANLSRKTELDIRGLVAYSAFSRPLLHSSEGWGQMRFQQQVG